MSKSGRDGGKPLPGPDPDTEQTGPEAARLLLKSIGGDISEKSIALDDLLENTTDAVILIDSENVVSFWNRGAENMFQHRREEVVGRKIGFIVPPDLLESRELEWLQRHIDREGSIHNHITRRIRKDGAELWVSLSRTVLHDTRGEVIGSTATIRDITEHRQTEAELCRARGLAMVGELAAKVAHEIKNPLAGIYGAIQLLARDVDPKDPKKEVFANVGREIRRLDEMIQELLRFARPVPPQPVPMELSPFLTDLTDQLRHQPEVPTHTVQVDVEDGLVVSLDYRLMGQVLTNLLLNAFQAMDSPGTILITARKQETGVVIVVCDTGGGIPEEQLDTIFDPFFTTKSRGTGLGLSVARKNVESHGGTIEAQNQKTGGAQFVITLPASLVVPK